jgi:hypothetical protein
MSTPEKAGKSRKKNFPVTMFLCQQPKYLNSVKSMVGKHICCICQLSQKSLTD